MHSVRSLMLGTPSRLSRTYSRAYPWQRKRCERQSAGRGGEAYTGVGATNIIPHELAVLAGKGRHCAGHARVLGQGGIACELEDAARYRGL